MGELILYKEVLGKSLVCLIVYVKDAATVKSKNSSQVCILDTNLQQSYQILRYFAIPL